MMTVLNTILALSLVENPWQYIPAIMLMTGTIAGLCYFADQMFSTVKADGNGNSD